MAIQLRRGDYTDFDPSQLLDGELAIVLENDPDTEDGTGTYVSYGNSNVKRLLTEDDDVEVPIASSETAGIVKPDSDSFYVDSYDGTMQLYPATDTTLGGVKISEYEAVGMQSDDHSLYVKTDESTITKNEYGQLTVIGGGGGGSDIDPYDSDPEMDGSTASAGSSDAYARGDHVHPTDTSRASASDLMSHVGDSTAHVTAAERSTWNAKASTATATTSANGLMSASDKTKLDGIADNANAYELPAATTSTLGGVKADGTTILIDADGTIHGAGEQAVPLMSPTTRGGAKLGYGLAIEDGALGLGAVSDPTDAGPIVELAAKGWAEQDTTVGKNLLPPLVANTKNGITLTVADDGTLTLDGTASSTCTFSSSLSIPSGTYTLSANNEIGIGSNTSDSPYMYLVQSSGSWGNNFSMVSPNRTDVRTLSNDIVEYRIVVPSNLTLTNFKLHPQLELGSTATDYEPYSGGAPSPSPSYPQEIRRVTGHTIAGKTGRYVDILVTHDGTTTTIPIPLPSRGWVAALPDGTADTLALDGAGGYVWTLRTEMQAVQSVSQIANNDYLRIQVNDFTVPQYAYVLCDTYRQVNRLESKAITIGGNTRVYIWESYDDFATIDDYRAWLSTHTVTVLYPLSTPTTEQGYVDMPTVPVHAAISSTDLHDLTVRCCADEGAAEIASAWGRRYESRIANLESAVATLVTAGA